MKVVNDCALKDLLLIEDKKIISTVVPKITAYHSLLVIKNIMDVKDDEKKKELEKAERENKRVTFQAENEEEKKVEEPHSKLLTTA
jgi:hypothetical protein